MPPTAPTPRPTSAIEISGLTKRYGSTTVLDGVDLTVTPGEIVALLGPNGAGKTTTVSILSTLVRADSGTVTVAGHDLARSPGLVRTAISVTGQSTTVDGFQTGRENLLMMCALAHLPRRARRERTAELLAELDLTDAADRRVDTYSGGMRRRLDLAISLVVRPAVLVLDEPTTGLDPRSRVDVWEVVVRLARAGTAVLLTTQYLEEADRLADRILVLNRGVVDAEGTASELKAALGGGHVRVTLADPVGLSPLRDHLAGAGEQGIIVDESAQTLTLPAADSVQCVRALLDAAESTGATLVGIDLVQPNLDDVFLALTAEGTPSASADRGARGSLAA